MFAGVKKTPRVPNRRTSDKYKHCCGGESIIMFPVKKKIIILKIQTQNSLKRRDTAFHLCLQIVSYFLPFSRKYLWINKSPLNEKGKRQRHDRHKIRMKQRLKATTGRQS